MNAIISVNSTKLKESAYVLHMIKELQKYCTVVFVCVNKDIEPIFLNEIKRINKFTKKYRSDIYINRWRDVIINDIGISALEKLDKLLLINDSIFGPLFPLNEIFESDISKYNDFWGITAHGKMMQKKKDGTEVVWPRFIQSYFVVFNNSILRSADFHNYIQELDGIRSFDQACERFEYTFADYFQKRGFRWDVYIDTKSRESSDTRNFESFILFDSYNLIKNYRMPFIPKYAFEIDHNIMQIYHAGDDLSRAIKYITENTEYDESLIYDNLLTRMNLEDISVRLNHNYIIQADANVIDYDLSTVAVFAYLFYEDLFEYSLQKLKEVPEPVDIVIGTDSEKKIEYLQELIIKLNIQNNVTIMLHQGLGRDLSALLITFKPLLLQYDTICFIHDKKSGQMPYVTVGESFNKNIWENLLENRKYIYGILNLFSKNRKLGFIYPPMVYHNLYFHTAIDPWTICFDETKRIADKIGVPIRIDREKEPVALGSAFWCKVNALKPLFEYEFESVDFPEEPMPVDGSFSHGMERIFPYIAQAQGYYSACVMTAQNAANHYKNYKEATKIILKEIDTFQGIDTATLLTTGISLHNSSFGRKKDVIKQKRRRWRRK